MYLRWTVGEKWFREKGVSGSRDLVLKPFRSPYHVETSDVSGVVRLLIGKSPVPEDCPLFVDLRTSSFSCRVGERGDYGVLDTFRSRHTVTRVGITTLYGSPDSRVLRSKVKVR